MWKDIKGFEGRYQVSDCGGVKSDNRVCNLEWCNNSMNQLHAYRMGLNERSVKAGKPRKIVYQIDINTDKVIDTYPSVAEAARSLNMKKSSNISLVCRGLRKTSGGYSWAYADESEVMLNDVK